MALLSCVASEGGLGVALVAGVYDTREENTAQRSVPRRGAGKDYKTVDLARIRFHRGCTWVAPVNNPGAVDAIFVDRFYLIRTVTGGAGGEACFVFGCGLCCNLFGRGARDRDGRVTLGS